MKNINILIIALLTSLFASCEEVIKVDLGSGEEKLVVDGKVIAPDGKCIVKLSKSVEYYKKSVFPKVTGASVVVTNPDNNKTYTLTETETGTYTSDVDIFYNTIYKLTIKYNGNTYTSESTLNKAVEIRDLRIVEDDDKEDEYKDLLLNFDDPKDVANYYRLKIYVNGKFFNKEVSLYSDDWLNEDGEEIETGVTVNVDPADKDAEDEDLIVKVNDVVTVEAQSIDKKTYKYFHTLQSVMVSGDGESQGVPANAETNIEGGALGYFSAYSYVQSQIKYQ